MTEHDEATQDRLSFLREALNSGSLRSSKRMINNMHPAEIADLLESLPLPQRLLAWDMVSTDHDGEVLLEVGDDVRDTLVRNMDRTELKEAFDHLSADDCADLLAALPETVTQEMLLNMDKQRQQQIEAILSYPEDTAGGLMDLDVITIRADVEIDVVLRYLRMLGQMPENTDKLFVVNRYNHYLGYLLTREVLTAKPDESVCDIMHRAEALSVEMPATEVSQIFKDRNLISAPVVGTDNILVGRITIDDVVDVIVEENNRSVMNMAGLNQDEDIFGPVGKSARRRAVWLGINLVTAFVASWTIGLFEATIAQVVALAVLMPIVASMGGIAGSQTLTLVIRAQALGQLGLDNLRVLFRKELLIGLLNGLIWSCVVAVAAALWFSSSPLGMTIGIALVVNQLAAAMAGVMIPIALKRLNVDPALAGSVVLTTVTDVVGFVSFLGIATLILL